MFEHLLDPQFDDIEDCTSTQVVSAQIGTDAWLEEIGAVPKEQVISERTRKAVQETFQKVTDLEATDENRKKAALTLKTPNAVRHLAGMLREYDWDYVEDAKQLRGYVVARTLELTRSPDPRIQLQALKMLGTVTEVGSFTERIEIKRTDATTDELQDRIRAKLASLLPKTVEVQDATPKE